MADKVGDSAAVEAEKLYDKIHRSTWARRVATMMAGATLFAAFGATGGVVAAFLPQVLGALHIAATVAAPTWAAIGSSAALFAGVAAFTGMVLASDVGANAASIATALTERDKQEPSKDITSVRSEEKAADTKKPKLFNWKVAAVMAPAWAAFGAMLSVNAMTAAPSAMMSFAPGSSAAAISSAIILGMFGSTLGVNASYLPNKLSNAYLKVLTGKAFEKAPEKELPKALLMQSVKSNDKDFPLAEPEQKSKIFVHHEKHFSLQALLEKSQESSGVPEVRIR